jgi:hypothetical protein
LHTAAFAASALGDPVERDSVALPAAWYIGP